MVEMNGYRKGVHLNQERGSKREGSANEQKVVVVVVEGRRNYFEKLVE